MVILKLEWTCLFLDAPLDPQEMSLETPHPWGCAELPTVPPSLCCHCLSGLASWPSSEGRWESQIHQLTWEHERGLGGQLWRWTSPLTLGTWLCFQQGPYFIAHFWEYALSKPGSGQQASVSPIFFQNFHLFPCFTIACVSGSCGLDYTPGLKYVMNPLQRSGWQWKCFLELSGLHASLTCCCGVLSSRRFHPSAMG